MLMRFTLLLLAAAPAFAEAPRWAAPLLAEGFAAHRAGDYGLASRDFKRLAGQGSAIAETMLGAMAARGQGAAVDPATAATWWLRAARRGYPPAQLAMAQACSEGRGLARDRDEAWIWARLAATHGDTSTALRAAVLANGLAREFAPEQRAALDKRLQNWRPWAKLTD